MHSLRWLSVEGSITSVDELKEFLRDTIGTTYAEATSDTDANLLGLDLKNWGGNRHARQQAPWEQIQAHEGSPEEWLKDTVSSMCPWHQWA